MVDKMLEDIMLTNMNNQSKIIGKNFDTRSEIKRMRAMIPETIEN